MKIDKVPDLEQKNLEKYGMDFRLAKDLFNDENARQLPADNPAEPRRKFYILRGTVKDDLEPLLCYFYRKRNNVAEIRTLCHWKDSDFVQYDFSNAEKNPYITQALQLISIRIPKEIIEYFDQKAKRSGKRYITLIREFMEESFREYKKRHEHKSMKSSLKFSK